jgi:hypothetical protein
MTFQTEFEFTLPRGYVDQDGSLQKIGIMRLATAADEILPQKDARVQQNPAYLLVVLLSRVITRLGDLSNITPKIIEGLFSSDLSFLQDFYQRINQNGSAGIQATCPKCEHRFEVESTLTGGY